MCDYYELWLLFDLIDRNDDFKLSRTELEEARPTLVQWGLAVSPNMDYEWMRADRNGSGSITFDEFVLWAHQINGETESSFFESSSSSDGEAVSTRKVIQRSITVSVPKSNLEV